MSRITAGRLPVLPARPTPPPGPHYCGAGLASPSLHGRFEEFRGVCSNRACSRFSRSESTFGLGSASRLSQARATTHVPCVSAETLRAIAYEVLGVWAGRVRGFAHF
jgi:hypothetical protein